jgi:hypothetical protein
MLSNGGTTAIQASSGCWNAHSCPAKPRVLRASHGPCLIGAPPGYAGSGEEGTVHGARPPSRLYGHPPGRTGESPSGGAQRLSPAPGRGSRRGRQGVRGRPHDHRKHRDEQRGLRPGPAEPRCPACGEAGLRGSQSTAHGTSRKLISGTMRPSRGGARFATGSIRRSVNLMGPGIPCRSVLRGTESAYFFGGAGGVGSFGSTSCSM